MRWKPPLGRCRCGNPIRILGRWCVSCARKEADRRISVYVRQRDGICLWPGCRVRGLSRLDAHHVQRKRYQRIRFDPDNLISLCRDHHSHIHANPGVMRELIEEIAPGRWKHLIALREHAGKVDLELVITTFGRRAA